MARGSKKREDVIWVFETLKSSYPPVTTFLTHDGPFQLLIAVILSAQCTDDRVNMVTPALFDAFPDAKALANADLDQIKLLIKSINFFPTKAKNIQKTAMILSQEYDGIPPKSLDELICLPGVGRKTANVLLGQAYQIPGITVDTHVKRLSQRLGYTKKSDANQAEKDLMKWWPESIWIDFSTLLILHGRQVCSARKPNCESCQINTRCPYGKKMLKR